MKIQNRSKCTANWPGRGRIKTSNYACLESRRLLAALTFQAPIEFRAGSMVESVCHQETDQENRRNDEAESSEVSGDEKDNDVEHCSEVDFLDLDRYFGVSFNFDNKVEGRQQSDQWVANATRIASVASQNQNPDSKSQAPMPTKATAEHHADPEIDRLAEPERLNHEFASPVDTGLFSLMNQTDLGVVQQLVHPDIKLNDYFTVLDSNDLAKSKSLAKTGLLDHFQEFSLLAIRNPSGEEAALHLQQPNEKTHGQSFSQPLATNSMQEDGLLNVVDDVFSGVTIEFESQPMDSWCTFKIDSTMGTPSDSNGKMQYGIPWRESSAVLLIYKCRRRRSQPT